MGVINSFQLSQVPFLPGHSAPRQMTSIIQGLFLNRYPVPWDKTANVPQCPSRELLKRIQRIFHFSELSGE